MQRRLFLKSLFAAISTLSLFVLGRKPDVEAVSNNREILLQISPVAGFQFYDGNRLWTAIRPNDLLDLVAEPDNPYDKQAVKVMWNGNQLGYVPRSENTAVSQMLGRGQSLTARISALRQSSEPWDRILMKIYLTQDLRYRKY